MEGSRTIDKISDEKRRAKNFSGNEIELLLELVKQNKNVLECKKTDAVSHKDKKEVWKRIENSFNRTSGEIYRDLKTLRGKYENLKKATKKRFTEEKYYSSGTGGGPSVPSVIESVDFGVKDILGDSQIKGGSSEFDSDFMMSTVPRERMDNEVMCNDLNNEHELNAEESVCSENVSQADFKEIKHLKTVPKSSLLKSSLASTKRVHTFNRIVASQKEKIDILASSKEELLMIQKQIYEEQLKFQQEEQNMKREEHKLRIESLKLDIKLKNIEVESKKHSLLKMKL